MDPLPVYLVGGHLDCPAPEAACDVGEEIVEQGQAQGGLPGAHVEGLHSVGLLHLDRLHGESSVNGRVNFVIFRRIFIEKAGRSTRAELLPTGLPKDAQDRSTRECACVYRCILHIGAGRVCLQDRKLWLDSVPQVPLYQVILNVRAGEGHLNGK